MSINTETLVLGTLYEVVEYNSTDNKPIADNISIKGGTVDLYSSNSQTQPTSLAEMNIDEYDTDIEGTVKIKIAPKYLALVQNTGTSTEITLTGVKSLRVINRGLIS